MGTDIVGVFSHRITFPPPDELAQSMRLGIAKVSPFIKNDWRLDGDQAAAPLSSIHDPHGLSIYFGPHAAIIVSGIGWDQVSEDPELRGMVTSAMCAVARFFQSPRVVYLPDDEEPWCHVDDWLAEGCTLEELEQKLARIRKPSPDFGAAIRTGPDLFKVDGYVIEEL